MPGQVPSTSAVRGMELPKHFKVIRNRVPHRVLHLVRGGFRRYGMVTSHSRAMPDYLVIGAKKAGTSSLMNWLVVHPAVARTFPPMQRLKSPHYFDINYWRGPSWYRSHFPSRWSRNRQAQRVGSSPVAGEASPYYLFHPAVPARVAQDLPDVRIIVLLRDPVARAYSNYWDRRENGSEQIGTFEEAIEAEPRRLAEVDEARLMTDPRYYSLHHDNHSYLARGHYSQQLSRWLEVVPPERLLIMAAESMFTDPVSSFVTVQEFLGIPVTTSIPLRPYNQRRHPPIKAETRARLIEYYRPHNAALHDMLGFDLGWEQKYQR